MNTSFSFSSKADVLQTLSAHAELNIPKVFSFSVDNWRADSAGIIASIADSFDTADTVAIRSSCRQEDTATSSGAGAYLSLLNANVSDAIALRDSVEKVIASYGGAQPDDQVLVQPMIRDVVVSGVMMTRVLTDGAFYYVINYDDESGETDTITGGKSANKTVYVYRDARDEDFDSPRLKRFVWLARHLEELCGSDALDIEFCLDAEGVLHLLQVRPICTQQHWSVEPVTLQSCLSRLADFITQKTGPAEGLLGQSSILGVMPDWNPAEMIGLRPRPLAASLYRDLITDRVWATARARMGYRPVPCKELMLLLLGRPYIDVRASFNSFLPAGIDDITGEALVTAWMERLETHPEFHDKIEFEIAQTSLDFCFDEKLDSRYPGLMTAARREDFRKRLLKLTRACLDDSPESSMRRAYEAVTELRNRHSGRLMPDAAHPGKISAAASLLQECRKYGTLPFSILARHAFIAEALLRSAVERGALLPERLRDFKLSIRTISGEMSHDFSEVCTGRRDALAFMRKYGHLRPGTYDILSPRYVDRGNLFADAGTPSQPRGEKSPPFELSPQEKANLEKLLSECDLEIPADALLDYAGRAIEGREFAKFVFSRNISDLLEILAYWGERNGLSREDVSFLDIRSLLDVETHALPESPHEYFSYQMERNRALLAKGTGIKLGYLIRSVRDIYVVPQHRAAPNFIGSKAIRGTTVHLFADSRCDVDLTGKIVCIENADPGFDWIFTRQIAGLVTKFGGTNSHMAIRCAEYGLPAAIGVGEKLYAEVSSAENGVLDPAARILKGCGSMSGSV